MKTLLSLSFVAATALIALPILAQDDMVETPAAVSAPVSSATKDFTVLKIGKDEVKNSEILTTWNSLFPEGAAPDFATFDENIRQNVLRGVASERLIYAEAIKAGADKSAEVKKRLADLQKQVIMQSFMEQKAKTLVSDAELKKTYDEKVASMRGEEELKARHILVASEAEAKAIAAELKKGADFDKVAKEKSTDKGSGAKGGDLGWFTKEKMVPEFGDAAFKMKKGEVSEPVKSPFGYHIIKLEDRRAVSLPSFEEMKDSLRGEVTNKAVQAYVEDLLNKSDIKYYGADGKEKTLSKSFAPAAGAQPAKPAAQ